MRLLFRAIFILALSLGFFSLFILVVNRRESKRAVNTQSGTPAAIKGNRCEAIPSLLPRNPDGKFFLHYIRFKSNDVKAGFQLRFTDYLSVISAVQYLKPDEILLHGDIEPTGEYWDTLKRKGVIRHVHKNLTSYVGRRLGKDKQIGFKEHSADISKLDVLLEYGGVVIDFDVFFIRGERVKEILKRKKAIVCYVNEDGNNIGFVAARPDSRLLWAWRRSYMDIYVPDWNFNQAFVAKFLTILYRDETYLARGICDTPNPERNLGDYFHSYGKLSWVNSMAIHSYERHGGVPIKVPDDLKKEPLTTHKELLLTVFENRPLPPFNSSFNDEVDPLADDCKPHR